MFIIKNLETNEYCEGYYEGVFFWCDNPHAKSVWSLTEEEADELLLAPIRHRLPKKDLVKVPVGVSVELPCKSGDTVYIPHHGKVEVHKVENFYINEFSVKINIGTHHIDIKLLGKTWFLSEKEAENALSNKGMTPSSIFSKNKT